SPPDGRRMPLHRSVLGHLTRPRTWTLVAALACTGVAMLPTGTKADLVPDAKAAPAPVGQGFVVNAADLAFILKQIKISERHSRAYLGTPDAPTPLNPTPTGDPFYCQSMIGPAADQIPSKLISFGLRTVSGECNNLSAGQSQYGAAHHVFPRLTEPVFRTAEPNAFGPPGGPNTS